MTAYEFFYKKIIPKCTYINDANYNEYESTQYNQMNYIAQVQTFAVKHIVTILLSAIRPITV